MSNLKGQGWRDAINKKKGLDVYHLRLAFKVTISQATATFQVSFFLCLYRAVPVSLPFFLVGCNIPSFLHPHSLKFN